MKAPLSVSALTFAIKNQLETQFRSLLVQGEISNFKPHSGGHLYFDLKDENAKIPAVLFKGDAAMLTALPKDGDQVIAEGTLSVYPPHGKYQLICRKLQLKGVGELLLRFQELKKKLESLGWFEQHHKKPLPKFPKRIGVVTSSTGAVIQDIIQVLTRRVSGFHLILNPVRVQGDSAAYEIAKAINQFNAYNLADVLIVGRGGGSLEDLWAFNEEIVAKAIFESNIPIISAVGHETDVSLSDFVADVRASTPTAAAEIVLNEKAYYLDTLKKLQKEAKNTLFHLTHRYKEKLKRFLTHPMLATPYPLLGSYLQSIDEKKNFLDQKIKEKIILKKQILIGMKKQALALRPSAQLSALNQRIKSYQNGINQAFYSHYLLKKHQLEKVTQNLIALDPKKVLKRGYSILFHQKNGSVIVSSKQLIPGNKVKALLFDGESHLIVSELNNG